MNVAKFSTAEMAWMTQQYLAGRQQNEIGEELGFSAGVICNCIAEFVYEQGCARDDLEGALQRFGGQPQHPGKGGSYLLFWEARRAHAARLREEGLTYREIGVRLGVTAGCAKVLAFRGARELARLRSIRRIPIK